MAKKKTGQPKSAIVKRTYFADFNGVKFSFFKGDAWDIKGEYPGNPGEKSISREYFLRLERFKILREK